MLYTDVLGGVGLFLLPRRRDKRPIQRDLSADRRLHGLRVNFRASCHRAGSRILSFRPHKHKTISKATYLCEIALVWSLAACVASLRLISNFTSKELLRSVFNYSMIICIFSSLILISLAYAMIWHRVRKPVNLQHRTTTAQEKKLAVTLSIITLVFALTWVPFYITNVIIMFCKSCYVLQLVYFAKFLHYSNSFANFVIYALKIREFRKTVAKILCERKQISMDRKKRQMIIPAENEEISIQDIRIRLSPCKVNGSK